MMEKIPLIPFVKPKPVVLTSGEQEEKLSEFTYTNTEYTEDKPAIVKKFWGLLSSMDPEGELFTSDKGLILVDGEYEDSPEIHGRRPEALGLTEDIMEMIEDYCVPDAEEEDDKGKIVPASVVGTLFTAYQMLEAIYDEAFEAGEIYAKSKITDALVSSVPGDDDEDDDDDEFNDELDFEDEDVITESSDGYDSGDEEF